MSKLLVLIIAFLLVFPAYGDVYKCMTSTGMIYSEHPCSEDKKKLDLHVAEPTETIKSSGSASLEQMQYENWKKKKKQEEIAAERKRRARPVARSDSTSTEPRPETDETRCKYARSILKGGVQLHRNGNISKMDSQGRELAENDVRRFCH